MKKILVMLLLVVTYSSSFAQVKTKRWEVKIPSLWCEECELIIESRMMRYDGISEIDAKWKSKKAVIRYIPDRLDTANIKVYISMLGFDTDEDKADESQRKLLPACCQKAPEPKGKKTADVATTPATTAATPKKDSVVVATKTTGTAKTNNATSTTTGQNKPGGTKPTTTDKKQSGADATKPKTTTTPTKVPATSTNKPSTTTGTTTTPSKPAGTKKTG